MLLNHIESYMPTYLLNHTCVLHFVACERRTPHQRAKRVGAGASSSAVRCATADSDTKLTREWPRQGTHNWCTRRKIGAEASSTTLYATETSTKAQTRICPFQATIDRSKQWNNPTVTTSNECLYSNIEAHWNPRNRPKTAAEASSTALYATDTCTCQFTAKASSSGPDLRTCCGLETCCGGLLCASDLQPPTRRRPPRI